MSIEKPCFILVDPELFESNAANNEDNSDELEIKAFINGQQSTRTKN